MKQFTYIDFLAYMGVGSAHPGGFNLTEKILQKEKLSPEKKLLDVGCGTGITAAYIASHSGCNVTAIDLHPEMIKKARRRIKNEQLSVKVLQANAENLPFEKESFDYVLTESVTAFTNINHSLSEYKRVLKKNGILLSLEMTAETQLKNDEKEEIKKLYGINEILTEAEWIKRLKDTGFRSIEVLYEGTPQKQLEENLNSDFEDINMPTFEPSEEIDPSIYGIWTEHEMLVQKYSTKLGHRVLRSIKN